MEVVHNIENWYINWIPLLVMMSDEMQTEEYIWCSLAFRELKRDWHSQLHVRCNYRKNFPYSFLSKEFIVLLWNKTLRKCSVRAIDTLPINLIYLFYILCVHVFGRKCEQNIWFESNIERLCWINSRLKWSRKNNNTKK